MGSAMHFVKEIFLSDHPGATLWTAESLTAETEAPSEQGSSREAREAQLGYLHTPPLSVRRFP